MRSAGRRCGLIAAAIVAVAVTAAPSGVARAQGTGDWPSYLLDPSHSSFNQAATSITPADAAALVPMWTWLPDPPSMPGQPAAQLFASPAVSNGVIYIGTNSGDFYALDEATGTVLWQRFFAYTPALTCSARGFTSTATIAPDPITGLETVYVAAADGYLYALNATDGSTMWASQVVDPGTTENDGYVWSSPTVASGHVYIGMSSQCDKLLIRGGLEAFDQATGALQATYFTVPGDSVGGSIWSSAAISSTGKVFVTTGNPGPGGRIGNSSSVVKLSADTLAKLSHWRIPNASGTDKDFGASPTMFSADLSGTTTSMVGACNKNGTFYALETQNLKLGPVWSVPVGKAPLGECLAAAIWDGSRLFVASDRTTIGGIKYSGSIRELDPATGSPVWETGLPGAVLGSPTMDGSGVIAVGSYDFDSKATNAVWLIDADDGSLLSTIDTSDDQVFAQPTFVGGMLLVATQDHGMTAYVPGA